MLNNQKQEILLEEFADSSDRLFELGIISTDSFTGEIGEYIACTHYKLTKTNRVTKAVDGICSKGKKYQIKSKIISFGNFTYSIDKLDTKEFEFLVIVYFDRLYNPIKILRIPSEQILNNKISITKSLLNSNIEIVGDKEISINTNIKRAINNFAEAYSKLEESGIIRSRRIVGDVGEFYACKYLNLVISTNKNEKGIDARSIEGYTFEIKTRRVYESGRRISETRRLNNLVGKSADYLIVVTLNRAFKCCGMWIVPMQNLINPKSANLKIVNTTLGTKNIIPSQITWLKTGDIFCGY